MSLTSLQPSCVAILNALQEVADLLLNQGHRLLAFQLCNCISNQQYIQVSHLLSLDEFDVPQRSFLYDSFTNLSLQDQPWLDELIHSQEMQSLLRALSPQQFHQRLNAYLTDHQQQNQPHSQRLITLCALLKDVERTTQPNLNFDWSLFLTTPQSKQKLTYDEQSAHRDQVSTVSIETQSSLVDEEDPQSIEVSDHLTSTYETSDHASKVSRPDSILTGEMNQALAQENPQNELKVSEQTSSSPKQDSRLVQEDDSLTSSSQTSSLKTGALWRRTGFTPIPAVPQSSDLSLDSDFHSDVVHSFPKTHHYNEAQDGSSQSPYAHTQAMSSSYIRALYAEENEDQSEKLDVVHTPIALKLAQAQNHTSYDQNEEQPDLESVPPLPFNMESGSVDFPRMDRTNRRERKSRLSSQRTPSSTASSSRSSMQTQIGYSELSEFQWGEEEMRSGPQGFGGVPSLPPQPQPEELTEAWSSMLEAPRSSTHKVVKLIALMLLVIGLGIGLAFLLPYLS